MIPSDPGMPQHSAFADVLSRLREGVRTIEKPAPGFRITVLLTFARLYPPLIALAVPVITMIFLALPMIIRQVADYRNTGLTTTCWLIALGTALSFLNTVLKKSKPRMIAVPLKRENHGELFELIDRTAAAVDTKPPDEVLLSLVPGFAVWEEASGMFSTTPRRRFLSLESSGLADLTVEEFASTLVHEMAHFSERHTEIGLRLYRTSNWLYRLRMDLRKRRAWKLNPLYHLTSLFFLVYRHLYFPLSRAHELRADAMAVDLLGAGAFLSGLKKEYTAAVLVSHRLPGALESCVAGTTPEDGLLNRLRRPAGGDQRDFEALLIREIFDEETGPHGTHPSIRDRIEAAVRRDPANAELQKEESGGALDFFLGNLRRDLEARLSRLLVEAEKRVRAVRSGLREAAPEQVPAGAGFLLERHRVRTEVFIVRLVAASCGVLLVSILILVSFAVDELSDSRLGLAVALAGVLFALVWIIRSKRSLLRLDEEGVTVRTSWTNIELSWNQVRAVRMGHFKHLVIGEKEGLAFKIPFEKDVKTEMEVVYPVLESAPALAALAWGMGLSRAKLPDEYAPFLPRAVRREYGDLIVEGPGENLFRFDGKHPDTERIERSLKERLLPLMMEEVS